MFKKMKWFTIVFFMFGSQLFAAGTLYMVKDGTGEGIYTVDTTTAAATPIALNPSYSLEGLALSANPSQFYAVNNDSTLYTVNIDGSGVTTGPNIDGDADRGLTYNTATGLLYGSDNSGFYSIDPITGTSTFLGHPASDLEGLAANPNLNVVYGLDNSENLYAYNVIANSWSLVGNTGINNGNDVGLAFDPTSNTIYAVESIGDLWSIDPASAASTLIGNVGIGTSDFGLTFVPKIVSVPLSNSAKALLALLFAFASFFMMHRRRVA